MNKPCPFPIACATDAQLVRLYDRPTHKYWRAAIRAEMNKRGIELSNQPPVLPRYATAWV